MTDTYRPDTEDHLVDLIAWANSERKPLAVHGAKTKHRLGRPMSGRTGLDLTAFAGVSLYEPEELVLAAGPATPLAEIEALLRENRQQLAFDPPDLSGLLGAPNSGTIGGVIACNLSGSRRIKDGAARDHFLGFDAVSGRAQKVKSGGRVMKNVTGYDLSKVLCGSYGTLAAMTAMTVKVLPAPEKTRTVLVFGLDPSQAVAALASGLNGPFEVSGAAWIPQSIADRSDTDHIRQAGGSVTALRIEGFGPSVEYRCAKLRDLLSPLGETEELHSHNSANFWKSIRDVEPFRSDDRVVWKISVAPTDAPTILSALSHLKAVEAYLDWAGGLIWLAVDAPRQGAHEPVRDAVNTVGGHATLIRAGDTLRNTISVFHPQPAPLAAITKRLKDSFDPNGVLNPGRMSEGV
ncbi:glycolate oxidase subunit GlcE [Rhodospirillaceae bacterium KN72]|uniref:Glycolate oxidase subunit GlcE n=1 Tax=Pacificispira spongiicola TaxID=2729598 RepID=A0A7Y0E238_9PROT|nr:glycolate oxidase subunit GlcE [Pacificispira spongiicola]NMM45823.1 glycolate oxidase subunit GlcE [Pacificispira spongiicola]